MGAVVFDNYVFDSWLAKKSDEILSKVDKEKISTEEMLILILKAQTNHFHHMDIEFREEFNKIDKSFERLESKWNERFEKLESKWNERFEKLESKSDERFEKLESKSDERFEKLESKSDERFEKMWSFQKWQAGIIIALFAGLYLKLFLG